MLSSTPIPGIARPVSQSERISIIDSLRGIAILGILLMNIPGFGLSPASSDDPSVLKEIGSVDYYTWMAVNLFPEGTQRALFSMLFGAGILLFIGGKEKYLEGIWPADYFFLRQLWLMVFSLFDVFVLLWFGDILLDYACLGLLMFTFRRLPAKKLLIAAGVCFVFMIARDNRDFYLEKRTIAVGERIEAIDTTKTKLTPRQEELLGNMTEFRESSKPEKKIKRHERAIALVTGSYGDLYEYRTGSYLRGIVNYLYLGIWDVVFFMFLGMAFFKMGILTGQAKTRIYWILCIIGLGIGLPLAYLRIHPMVTYHFNWFEYTKHMPLQLYELSRTFRSLGIFGLIMLLYKSGLFKWFFSLMRPVGQMAFTNYLGQSLLCGIFFYGIGFGMYGKLHRHEIYYVVGVIWLIQIIWSHLWLRYFNFGPLEWLWRSLTYWKRQPIRKKKAVIGD
jgi:uncharacterized protein